MKKSQKPQLKSGRYPGILLDGKTYTVELKVESYTVGVWMDGFFVKDLHARKKILKAMSAQVAS